MQLRSFVTKSLLLLIIAYIIVVLSAIATTVYLFLNVNQYKLKIEQFIASKTNYNVMIGKVNASISWNLAPTLQIAQLQITDKLNPTHNFVIQHINLQLSISSIIYWTPVFNKLDIQGTNLAIDLNQNNQLVVNGVT